MRTAARWRLLLRFLRGSYPGLALTVLAVACGVGLVCAIDLASRAALQAFVEVVDTMAGRAALQVGSGEGGVFAEEVAATVAGVPGVAHALPLVSASAFTIDGSGEQLAVYGVDLTDEAVPDVYGMRGQEDSPHPIEDTLAFLAQPDSVLLTRTFARERGLVVGDRVELMTPAGRRALTVRGLLEPSGIARVHGGTLAVMDLFAAEAVFTRPAFVQPGGRRPGARQ